MGLTLRALLLNLDDQLRLVVTLVTSKTVGPVESYDIQIYMSNASMRCVPNTPEHSRILPNKPIRYYVDGAATAVVLLCCRLDIVHKGMYFRYRYRMKQKQ